MKKTIEAGIKKKSFELYFNGGSIWCEHLNKMSLRIFALRLIIVGNTARNLCAVCLYPSYIRHSGGYFYALFLSACGKIRFKDFLFI